MSDFTFDFAPQVGPYLKAIVDEMVSTLRIDVDEAIGRINRHWSGIAFEDQADVDALFSELPDYWARRIYYGPNAKWWLGGNPEPLPYP